MRPVPEVLLAGAAVSAGALVRGAVGYGPTLVAAPLLALGLAGQLHSSRLTTVLWSLPFPVAGFLLPGPAHRFPHGQRMRVAVPTVAAVSALVLLLRGAVGRAHARALGPEGSTRGTHQAMDASTTVGCSCRGDALHRTATFRR